MTLAAKKILLAFVIAAILTSMVICCLAYVRFGSDDITITLDCQDEDGNLYTFVTQASTDISLKSFVPERDGYRFDGWSTDADSTDAEYKPDDYYHTGGNSTTLYAVWKRRVLVLFNDNFKGGTSHYICGFVGDSVGYTPSRTDYTLLGWSEDEKAAEADYPVDLALTQCIILYAVWQYSPVEYLNTSAIKYTSDGIDGNIIQTTMEEIQKQFPNGSFFTANRQSCTHKSYITCDNCRLSNIMPALGLDYDENIYGNGWTCYTFASYVFGSIFGRNCATSPTVVRTPVLESEKTEEGYDSFYAYFRYAKMGDSVEFQRSTSKLKHYAIFVSCTESSVTLMNSNAYGGGGTNAVMTAEYTYDELRTLWKIDNFIIRRASNYNEKANTKG